jgi:hypothetical protein
MGSRIQMVTTFVDLSFAMKLLVKNTRKENLFEKIIVHPATFDVANLAQGNGLSRSTSPVVCTV